MANANKKVALTPLPAVPTEIKRRFGGDINYRRVYNMVLNGQVPSAVQKNGHYELDVNELAEVLGLTEAA